VKHRRRGAILPATMLLLAAPSCAPKPAPDRPNVLLVVIDTLRADRLSTYGSPRSTSPVLDRIAAEGALFTQAIAPSPWSPPSHTTIITGRHPYGHRILEWGHAIPDDVSTLAERLDRGGYATGLFSSHKSLARGVGRFPAGYDSVVTMSNERDDRVLESAAEWIAGQEGPWFAHVILMTPHAPYTKYPAALDHGLYEDVPAGNEREYALLESNFVGDGGIPRSVALPPHRDAAYYRNRYDRAIRHVDDLLGRFLDRLPADPPDRPTLLVVASDHGESFGERDSFAHEVWLDDHLVRVPLLIRLPGRIPAGSIRSDPVELTDLVPTLLSWAGADTSGTDGVDLRPGLEDDAPPPEGGGVSSGSYVTGGYRRFFVRTDRHKLSWDAVTGEHELFDLHADPGERRDLLADGSPPELPAGAFARLDSLLADRLDAYSAAIPELESIDLPADVTEELRALGYVD
jgi:arylsulfatase A-like enzyme